MQIRNFKKQLERFEEEYPEAPVMIKGNGEPSSIRVEEEHGYNTIVIKTGTKY